VIQKITLDQFSYEEKEARIHDELIRPLLTANTIRPRTLADARYEVVVDSGNRDDPCSATI
jgi:hypothetical protein